MERMDVRAGKKEHQFCRSVRHRERLFQETEHTYSSAAEVDPQP
jgi:hypothetical protein